MKMHMVMIATERLRLLYNEKLVGQQKAMGLVEKMKLYWGIVVGFVRRSRL